MEFRKMVTITLCAKQKRDTDVQNRLWDSVEKKRVEFLERTASNMYIIKGETVLQPMLNA